MDQADYAPTGARLAAAKCVRSVEAMLSLGRTAEAIAILEDGMERFPDNAELAQLQQRLEKTTASNPASEPTPVREIIDGEYRCPTDLMVTPTRVKRVMVLGVCVGEAWPKALKALSPECIADHFLINNAFVLPEELPVAADEYDFHFVQLPFTMVLPERAYFGLSLADPAQAERLFAEARERLLDALARVMQWNRTFGILTFVCNFLVPQQNPLGRLLPRYDLRNFIYFVEQLNEVLGRELQKYNNAYLFDYDHLVNTYGKRHLQDDVVWAISRGAALTNFDWLHDKNRLDPIAPVSEYYPTQPAKYVNYAVRELLAMYRTISQSDLVKLVLVDLDDTLWRGVAAEGGGPSVTGGWPIGFVEALLLLKQRGVLLGIVSKNDEARVRELWPYRTLLRPEDFVLRKINWRPKSENIEEILTEVNLLPSSVVFIDDNPVERAAVKAAFPDMRVLGPNPYLWRRILLWSPETQVATISAESMTRHQMVQKQVEREQQRSRLSRAEFLASLNVKAAIQEVASTSHPHFPRALELINKTNQFNTTGKRWSMQECTAFFDTGGRFFVLHVTDNYTAYGLVGVLVVSQADIVQFVLSCRVVGMDVEIAAVAGVLELLDRQGATAFGALLVETSANLLCRDLWTRCGFAPIGDGRYRKAAESHLPLPAHIAMQVDATPALLEADAGNDLICEEILLDAFGPAQ